MKLIITTYDKVTKVYDHPYRYEVFRDGNIFKVIVDNELIDNVKSIIMNEKKSVTKFSKFRGNA